MPHQHDAAKRIAGSLDVFGGALLADSVGLGKTYVSLAVATRYKRITSVVPAALVPQWKKAAERVAVRLEVLSHESLSRNQTIRTSDLIIVDEAHRFRNDVTKRYDRLARDIGSAHLLMVTATPVVNGARDLVNLLRLFLADHSLAICGVDRLDKAVHENRLTELAKASTPLVVARTSRMVPRLKGLIPTSLNSPLIDPPSVPDARLPGIIRLIDSLQFPNFERSDATDLLRLHLFYRLASSRAALMETVRRHEAYLLNAIEAAKNGKALTRSNSRSLFSVEDLFQLDFLFELGRHPSKQLETAQFDEELTRLRMLLSHTHETESPKLSHLKSLLAQRSGGRTLVFCNSVATAFLIASSLGWTRCAVATGAGARVASGPLGLESVLNLFSPRSRRAMGPNPAEKIDTLIATDLVSEGLDLQDADAVVNFDLPWTAVRLEQRIGRIARLGSSHRKVQVHWFVPPPSLERRLLLVRRISAKASSQLLTGAPSASRVGSATQFNHTQELREKIAALGECNPNPKPPIYSIVKGPSAALFAVRWSLGSGIARELVLLTEPSHGPEMEPETVYRYTLQLIEGSASNWNPKAEWLQGLQRILRDRIAHAYHPTRSATVIRLTRTAVKLGAKAGKNRNIATLTNLDRVIDILVSGAPVGCERAIADYLAEIAKGRYLALFPAKVRGREISFSNVGVEAALIGDGSV